MRKSCAASYPGRIRRGRGWLLLLAAALGLAPSACRRPASPPPPPLRVAIDLWAGYYPLVIAAERGYLRDEHVAVDVQVPGDTHRMIADFAARRYDLIGVSLADVVLTTRVNPDLRMILNSDESAGADVIFGRGPFAGPASLRGRRLATTLGGFGELFVRQFLEQAGVRPDEVTLVNVDAASVPALLARGEIDVGHTWEPYAAAARAAGFQEWFTSARTPGLIVDGLMAHGAVIRERSADLRGLVRAWFRAVTWWQQHPEEGNRLVEHHLQLPAGSVSWQGIRLLDREANRRAFAAGEPPGSLRRASALYVDFFLSRGTLNGPIPPEALLDPRFVNE